MNWRGSGRNRLWSNSCTNLEFVLRGSKKTTRTLSQDKRCLVRDLKPATPEIKHRHVAIQIYANLFSYHQQQLYAISDLSINGLFRKKNLTHECKILKHESMCWQKVSKLPYWRHYDVKLTDIVRISYFSEPSVRSEVQALRTVVMYTFLSASVFQ
jgi:hypothetical protein